jgi:plasmid stabilization system protein ParE
VKLVVSQAAQADLLRLHDFLADANPDAARRAVSAIVGAIDSLDRFPERGRPSPVSGMRELIVPFGQSNYVVRYAYDIAREELVIVRAWHSRESRE